MLASLIQPVTGILDKFIEDKDQKALLAHEIATMSEQHAQQSLLAQLEINKAEAASGSLFKGGWRPAVGWVCALAFAYHFIIKDLIIFGCAVAGVEIPELPNFDMGTLLTVLGGMLGIGSLRTYEKQKGLTK
jgi:ABC-type lipopolysaccharide export system ATPase subunit